MAKVVSPESPDPNDANGKVQEAILKIIGSIPTSKEVELGDPKERAQELITNASMKCAGIAGALAIPPGPLGLLTIIPDLMIVWQIQKQLVADIASTYGKSKILNKEVMMWCMFKHGGAQVLKSIVTRVGERIIIRRASLRLLQQMAGKIGIRVTQRLLGKTISRWIPLLGAAGVAWYAYSDTTDIGMTCIETFEREIIIKD